MGVTNLHFILVILRKKNCKYRVVGMVTRL